MRRLTCVVAVTCALLAVPSSSRATGHTQVQMSAASCRPVTFSESALTTYSTFGLYDNNSLSAINVVCPLVTDFDSVSTTAGVYYINVSAYDRNCSSDITATFYSQYNDGTTFTSSAANTTGCSTPVQTLTASPPNWVGTVLVWVTIPPIDMGASFLTNFWYLENR